VQIERGGGTGKIRGDGIRWVTVFASSFIFSGARLFPSLFFSGKSGSEKEFPDFSK
jgi:hypothetical protein